MVLEKCCTDKPTPPTSLCKDKSKIPGPSKMKFECLDCEVFKRKIKENEQSVSSRDVLIDMLQSEIRKIQNLYKNSIDDYEKLRFIHCSTVQDFGSVKEIYRKIEAENKRLLEEKTSLLAQLRTLEDLQQQLGLRKKENGQQNALDDFAHIENIMQTQNQSLKQLLSNFLEDLKISKPEVCVDKSCQAIGDSDEVEKLREDNQKIRENLNAKQDHLTKCLDVLEKNHLDIGNLSTHIEKICCERDTCVKSLADKDDEIAKLKNEIVGLQKTSPEIEELRVEKERYRQENMKLKKVIDDYRSENETKNDVIDKHEDEKEVLHDELGKYKRLSEQLQDDIASSIENKATEVQELTREKQILLQEKQQYIKEIEDLKSRVEKLSPTINGRKESCSANESKPQYLLKHADLERLQEKNEQLQQELEFVRIHHKCCSEVQHLESSNENLRDTLEIVTAENKANLKAKDALYAELKEARNAMEECEKEMEHYRRHTPSGDNKLTQCPSIENSGKAHETIDKADESPKEIEVSVKHSDAREKKQRQCLCNVLYGEKRQSQVDATKNLEDKIESLKHDLDQANLEIAEYEEENKSLRQKLDALTNGIGDSKDEISRLEQCYKECEGRQSKMRQDFSALATEKDETINRLKANIDRLVRQKSELSGNERKLSDLQAEKTRLEQENTMLRTELEELENTLTETSSSTEEKALRLEKRIEQLEEQDEEKQKRLENCVQEMDKIQVSLNAEGLQKEQIDNDILNLKNINIAQAKEIDNLKNSIEYYKSLVGQCHCMDPELDCEIDKLKTVNKQLESRITSLEGELKDKQCVIVKLEECLDNSNIILGDCEEELKGIHQENDRLKRDLEALRNNLDEQANESEVRSNENNMLVEEITQNKRKSEQLEKEIKRLASINTDQKTIEDRIARLQEEYNKLLQESKEKDIELEKITKQFEALQEYFKQPNRSQDGLSKQRSSSKESNQLVDADAGTGSKKKCVIGGKPVTKQDELKCLQCKNDELKEEVDELKCFVNKVVTDNNSLKLAITSLLNTVVNKIKIITDSKENLKNPTAADKVTTEGEDNEPLTPTTSKCDCMEIIKSKYDLRSLLMRPCEPCAGACDKILEERKIETVMSVRETEGDRKPESRKASPSQSSCCEEALKRCCKGSG